MLQAWITLSPNFSAATRTSSDSVLGSSKGPSQPLLEFCPGRLLELMGARQDDALGRRLEIVDRVARGEAVQRISRAGRGRAVGAATQVRLDVREQRRDRLGGLGFQSPLLLRTV